MEEQIVENNQIDEQKTASTPQANPYSLFLIFILLYFSFNSRFSNTPESQRLGEGKKMKAFAISDEDIQLINAVKPFMSSKSQELLDMIMAVINVFRPEQPDQTLNIEALKTLLNMVHESFEAQKVAEMDDDAFKTPEHSKDVQNLLNVISEHQA